MTMYTTLLLLCLALSLPISSLGEYLCKSVGAAPYTLREGTEYCYRYVEVALDFSSANRSCVRDKAALVSIRSASEDSYINETYYNNINDFWIGLSDQASEGTFRWLDGGSLLTVNDYSNWAGGSASASNELNKDCVKYSKDGWQVHDGYCQSSRLPFLCKLRACNSSDRLNCDTPPEPISTLSRDIIAVIVVIPLAAIVIVIVVIVLVLLWKYKNDFFHQYICFCAFGNSKKAMNSLKQENQRLRHEISQQKINTSGHFQRGQLAHQLSTGSIDRQQSMFYEDNKAPFRSMSMASNKVVPLSLSGSFRNNPGMFSQNTGINPPMFSRGVSQSSIASKQPWIMGNKPNALLPVIHEAQTPLEKKNLKNKIDPHESSPSSSSVSSNESLKIAKNEDTEKEAETNKTNKTDDTRDKSKQ